MILGIAHHNRSFDLTQVCSDNFARNKTGKVMQTAISIFFQLHGHTPDQTKVSKQELAFTET